MPTMLSRLAVGASLVHASIVPFWTPATKRPACVPGGKNLCKAQPGKFDGLSISIDIDVGGQHQRVQFDTGSADLAVFAKACGDACGKHPLDRYDADKKGKVLNCHDAACSGYNTTCYKDSVEALKDGCQMGDSYGDGSGFTAIVYEDSFGMWGQKASTKINVGAVLDSYSGPTGVPFQDEKSDGILGTGFMIISSSNPKAKYNPIVALAKAQGKPGIFSMCFAQGGGAFGIGEVLPHYTGEFVIEPVVPQVTPPRPGSGKHGYWSVRVQAVKVFGKTLEVDPAVYTKGESIVDSGTTVMMLPQPAFDAFVASVQNDCVNNPLVGQCVDEDGNKLDPSKGLFAGGEFKLSKEQISKYPTLDIVMTNSTVSVAPESYIICLEDPPGSGETVCVAMLQPGTDVMLGDGFLAGLTTVYDQDNLQIRFAKSKGCPAPALFATASTIVV